MIDNSLCVWIRVVGTWYGKKVVVACCENLGSPSHHHKMGIGGLPVCFFGRHFRLISPQKMQDTFERLLGRSPT